jgi:ribonuclease HI
VSLWNDEQAASEPLEWRSVLDALRRIPVETARAALGTHGAVAYTDGACIKNPGGPAGWSVILVSADYVDGDRMRKDAPRIECYGHIPPSENTTNNRAEIAAVLAALSLAPRDQPLTIHSDSDYTIKVAQGVYKMKANSDLWDYYRLLLNKRAVAPAFVWVRGHAGHDQNERADELAGLGAFNDDVEAYRRWQASNSPEARTGLLSPELTALRQQVQRLHSYFDSAGLNNARITTNEREFIRDMAKRFQKNNFAPTEKQINWVNVLARKYRDA